MPPLSWASTAVILLSAATTLLLLRNNQIPLHQSSNFILSLSNYLGSGTILFGITVCTFSLYITGANTVDISSVSSIAGSVLLFDILSSVILSDLNISSSASIVSGLCPAVLSVHSFYQTISVSSIDFFFTIPSLQSEPNDTLPNVTTLDLAQIATQAKT